MESVILVTFKIKGIPTPLKIASACEPTREQISKKLIDLGKQYDLNGDLQFKKLLKENDQKMYIYEFGEKKCMVLVEKLEKIIEFAEEYQVEAKE